MRRYTLPVVVGAVPDGKGDEPEARALAAVAAAGRIERVGRRESVHRRVQTRERLTQVLHDLGFRFGRVRTRRFRSPRAAPCARSRA